MTEKQRQGQTQRKGPGLSDIAAQGQQSSGPQFISSHYPAGLRATGNAPTVTERVPKSLKRHDHSEKNTQSWVKASTEDPVLAGAESSPGAAAVTICPSSLRSQVTAQRGFSVLLSPSLRP